LNLFLCGASLQQGSSTSDKRTIISESIDSGKVVIMEITLISIPKQIVLDKIIKLTLRIQTRQLSYSFEISFGTSEE
jgi:hypothetical protein